MVSEQEHRRAHVVHRPREGNEQVEFRLEHEQMEHVVADCMVLHQEAIFEFIPACLGLAGVRVT